MLESALGKWASIALRALMLETPFSNCLEWGGVMWPSIDLTDTVFANRLELNGR